LGPTRSVCHLACCVRRLQKLEVPCHRRGVAFAKTHADHDANVPRYARPSAVALLALCRCNGPRVFPAIASDIERVVDPSALSNRRRKTPCRLRVAARPSHRSLFAPMRRSQSRSRRCSAFHSIEEEERAAFRHGAIHAILQCPSAPARIRTSARNEPGRAGSPPRCGRRAVHGRSGSATETVGTDIRRTRQPALRGQTFSVPASWNDNTVCEDPHRTLR